MLPLLINKLFNLCTNPFWNISTFFNHILYPVVFLCSGDVHKNSSTETHQTSQNDLIYYSAVRCSGELVLMQTRLKFQNSRSASVRVNGVVQKLRLRAALNTPFQTVFLNSWLYGVTEKGFPSQGFLGTGARPTRCLILLLARVDYQKKAGLKRGWWGGGL